MASSLSDIVKNTFEGIHKTKCKHGHDEQKSETCRTKYECCDCFIEYTIKRLCCSKIYQQNLDEKLKERFF